MANEIQICDECKKTSEKRLLARLKKLYPDAEIKSGCISYCGHCTKRAVMLINGRHITAPDEEALLEKMKKYIK
ncbi:MAG: DUF1450 domain-containing protein [Bacillaceae bacterium]|nr:DUF1450 domain-containing protein [Bacillaceae bacterium]